jgi:hypothetical protein
MAQTWLFQAHVLFLLAMWQCGNIPQVHTLSFRLISPLVPLPVAGQDKVAELAHHNFILFLFVVVFLLSWAGLCR